MASPNSRRPIPFGETTPIPVITTRCIVPYPSRIACPLVLRARRRILLHKPPNDPLAERACSIGLSRIAGRPGTRDLIASMRPASARTHRPPPIVSQFPGPSLPSGHLTAFEDSQEYLPGHFILPSLNRLAKETGKIGKAGDSPVFLRAYVNREALQTCSSARGHFSEGRDG